MGDSRQDTALFWAHYKGPTDEHWSGVEESLRAHYEAGRAAWPELQLTYAAFVRGTQISIVLLVLLLAGMAIFLTGH